MRSPQQSVLWKSGSGGDSEELRVGLEREGSLAAVCRRGGIRRDQKQGRPGDRSGSLSGGKQVGAIWLGRKGHI